MIMKTMKTRASVLLSGLLACTGTAFADAVTDWNEITMNAVTASRPGPVGMADVALVQVAVHDAVQAIEKRYEPYHVELKGARGSLSAAVAAAAHGVLAGIYPDPAKVAALDATYANYLAEKGLTQDPGLAVGEAVAARILPLRRATPNPLPPPFTGSDTIGMWRPTDSYIGNPPAPAPFSPMVTPWLGKLDPFTLTGPGRFRADPPPALTSELYRRDFEEVKALGSLTSTTRTAAQTDLAYFYNDNFFTQWNRVLRSVADCYITNVGDSARLLALANMATADALINVWDSKNTYPTWRPVTAIHQAAMDGNPQTEADLEWRPLVNTPNYPEHASGANNLVAAMTRTMERFFNTDRMSFVVTSLNPMAQQKTRTYRRFSDATRDLVNVRVYQGIHFRFSDTIGRGQGRKVADWTFDHFLLPVDGRGGHRNDAGM
jgi:hypothetical protein